MHAPTRNPRGPLNMATALNRRRFMKLAALGSAGLGLAPYVRAAKLKPHACDVVVIGAGMAGISAAVRIATIAPQLRIVVLEARNRIGGRVHAEFTPGGKPMELGAAWIHDADNSPLTPLAESFDLELVDTPYTDLAFRQDGVRLDLPETTEALTTFVDISADLLAYREARIEDLLPDTNLQVALDTVIASESPPLSAQQLRDVYCMSKFVIGLSEGAEYDQVSVFGFGQDDNVLGLRDSFVLPSYATLIQDLATSTNLDVRLGHAVLDIDWSGPVVRVTTTKGLFTAPQVVVTVPSAVLNSGNIGFTPALPTPKLAALSHIGSGVISKLYLGFATAFWDPDVTFIARVPVSPAAQNWVPWLNVGRFLGTPLIAGFNSGQYASDIESMTDTDVVAAAMTELQGMYGNSIPQPTYYARSHWPAEPYSLAAYPYLKVNGSPDDYDMLKATVADRLYFAGDSTSILHPRSVRGAYETGQDAGNAILTYRGLLTPPDA